MIPFRWERAIDPQAAADLKHVSRNSVYKAIRAGRVTAKRLGDRWWLDRDSVLKDWALVGHNPGKKKRKKAKPPV